MKSNEMLWDKLVTMEKEADERCNQEDLKITELMAVIDRVEEFLPKPRSRAGSKWISRLRYQIRLARKRQKYHGLKWAKALHAQAALITQEEIEEMMCPSALAA